MKRYTSQITAAVVAIIVVLGLNVLRPTQPAHAAGPKMYKVVAYPSFNSASSYEQALNQLGKEGWHLVAIPALASPYLIFEKD